MHIVVRHQFCRLVIRVLEAVRAQTSFVNDKVCNVLCVFDSCARMIDLFVSLIVLRLESKLDFVDTVAEAEDGEVSSFNSRNSLLELALFTLIIGCDRYEMSELLCGF